MNVGEISLPLVSVGIPTYNRPEGLRRTLECITGQTFHNLEIIVSDNGSTNPEVEHVIKEFQSRDARIKYFKQKENQGSEYNFKFVLEKSSGKYFMWAADDDLHEKTFISSLVACFVEGEDIIFAGSLFDTINFVTGVVVHNENIPLLAKENAKLENFLQLIQTPTPSFIYGIFLSLPLKQSRFIQLSAFDFGDVFLLYEIALLGRMCVVSQTLYHAGVTEVVRFPKSFAKFKFPGFKFGYSTYYFETVKLILRSDSITLSEKMRTLQLINSQVYNIVLYHEGEKIYTPMKYLMSTCLNMANKICRLFGRLQGD